MTLPKWLPRYDLKKLTYHLPLLIFFILLLLHSTIDSNNLYTRTVFSVTKFISRGVDNYLSTTNFIKNPSFEDRPSPIETLPSWGSFGMKLSENPANYSKSASTLDLVTITQHYLSQTITFPFPPNSQFLLSFDLKLDDATITPSVNLTAYHFDNTYSTSTWVIDNIKTLGNWEKLSHSFVISKPSYKITIKINVDSNKPVSTHFDNFDLSWQSSE